MARVSFSALIEEITGKLAGSVFQDSYGGFQIRTRVSPRNPRTNYQQLRRGEFGFISSLWRGLDAVQRQTFIDAASTPRAALNLFIQSNVNLTLIEEPTISSYSAATTPALMPIGIIAVSPAAFLIAAVSGLQIVPTATRLLIYVTFGKALTQVFTNPSQYSPVLSFPAGFDISLPIDIIAEYNTRFGQLPADSLLGLKSVLVSTINGTRGAEFITSSTSEEMQKFTRLTQFLVPESNSGTSATPIFNFTIPGNTFIADGDTIEFVYWGVQFGASAARALAITTDFTTQTFSMPAAATGWKITMSVIRSDSVSLQYQWQCFVDAQLINSGSSNGGVATFADPINTGLQVVAPAGNGMIGIAGYLNLQLT